MPPKRGKKKAANARQAKKNENLKLLEENLAAEVKNKEEAIETDFRNCIELFQKKYKAALNNIPRKCHDMTIKEYEEYRRKEAQAAQNAHNLVQGVAAKYKCLSEKKKRKRIQSVERTEKMSSHKRVRHLTSGAPILRQLSFSNTSRQALLNQYTTPLLKKNYVVPPSKVRKPMSPIFDTTKLQPRRPKPGEIMVSANGSPVIYIEPTPLRNSTNLGSRTQVADYVDSKKSTELLQANNLENRAVPHSSQRRLHHLLKK